MMICNFFYLSGIISVIVKLGREALVILFVHTLDYSKCKLCLLKKLYYNMQKCVPFIIKTKNFLQNDNRPQQKVRSKRLYLYRCYQIFHHEILLKRHPSSEVRSRLATFCLKFRQWIYIKRMSECAQNLFSWRSFVENVSRFNPTSKFSVICWRHIISSLLLVTMRKNHVILELKRRQISHVCIPWLWRQLIR